MSDETENGLRPVGSFLEENRVFVEGLRDPDEDVRRRTLAEIEELDDELAEELLRIVGAPGDEELRADVAISLGPTLELCDDELDDEGRLLPGGEWWNSAPLSPDGYGRVTTGLRRVYLDAQVPRLVRRRALEASVRSPQEWHEGAIRAAWASADGDWRQTAVFCMGFHYRVDFEKEIEEGLRDDATAVRREAIRAAGRRGLVDMGSEILAVAVDEGSDPELRYAAVEALPYLEVPGAREVLTALLRSADDTLQESAEAALEELLLVERLEADLDQDPDELY